MAKLAFHASLMCVVFFFDLQPFEAQAFAVYMARSALFVDVWDGDSLMHLGTLAIPLRALMRQQKGVVKTAMVRTVRHRFRTRRTQPCRRVLFLGGHERIRLSTSDDALFASGGLRGWVAGKETWNGTDSAFKSAT